MERLKILLLSFLLFFSFSVAEAQFTPTTIQVKFSEWMDTIGFTNPNNFRWTGGLITFSAELIDTSVALIRVSQPEVNKWYTLKVFNLYDLAGNLIDPEHDTTGFIIKILPVELSSFTSEVINEDVHLEWITKTEVNNYGFNVERKSINSDWEILKFIEGHGNSNSPKTYNYVDKNPIGGINFRYRLKQIDTDGKFQYSNEIEVNVVPRNYSLFQNFPNPFNPVTTIRYGLPRSEEVLLTVYNIDGESVKILVNEEQSAGKYEVMFDASYHASGVYFYQLKTRNFVETKKMLLIK